jgi:Ni/Co efflux regulator RcnB
MNPRTRLATIVATLLASTAVATPALAAGSDDADSARHQGMQRMHEQMMSGDNRGMERMHEQMMSGDNPAMKRMHRACMKTVR